MIGSNDHEPPPLPDQLPPHPPGSGFGNGFGMPDPNPGERTDIYRGHDISLSGNGFSPSGV
ncbi:hypothetical protein [Streptomyces sp. KL118A]|uniref:hypothetical protein n=1 Tax=Streptomyces sp. KL118A TaxID=3045153 RepID=UPI00278C4A2D|nr:hypothetical protein [Streptomyces sp. KL118A]